MRELSLIVSRNCLFLCVMSVTSIGHPLFSASKNNTKVSNHCQREINVQFADDITISLYTVVDDTLDSGGSIWNGGYYLSKHLLQHTNMVRDKTVLELGSGCGLSGIVSSICQATHTVLTDIPEQVPYLQRNVDRNAHLLPGGCTCICAPLEWGAGHRNETLPTSYDVILAADVGFDVQLHEPLVSTLLLYASAATDVYLVEERRWKDVYDWYQEVIAEHFDVIDRFVISKDSCRAPVILSHVRKKVI